MLDADSGSGEEPGLEERELLAWAGAGNASRHGERGAAGSGCCGHPELMGMGETGWVAGGPQG